MDLHHVGIATREADPTAERLAAILDVPICHSEAFEGLEIRYLDCGGAYIELLEPREGGTVARFLERNGPGLHHVGFRTSDIADRLARSAAAGVELIDETPRAGAWGLEIAFLHPGDTGGVLIELVSDH